MKLWIRSQDRKSLTKVSNIEYTYKEGDLYTNVRGNHYLGTYYDNLKILGEYKTKERALEVLDEIQKRMMINETLIGDYEQQDIAIKGLFLKYNSIIYEMPKE